MKHMKKDPIILMLRKPCSMCAKGPYVLRDKRYQCSAVGPVRGRCRDWMKAEVLIVYDEEPV